MEDHAAAGLTCHYEGAVAIITLNRPQRLNALSRPLCHALVATAEALSADLAQMYDRWEHLEKLKKASSAP